jgi:hypothetical protein
MPAVLDRQRPNSYGNQSDLARKVPDLQPMEFFLRLRSSIPGVILVTIGHWAFLCRWAYGDCWNWRKQFATGLPGWLLGHSWVLKAVLTMKIPERAAHRLSACMAHALQASWLGRSDIDFCQKIAREPDDLTDLSDIGNMLNQ